MAKKFPRRHRSHNGVRTPELLKRQDVDHLRPVDGHDNQHLRQIEDAIKFSDVPPQDGDRRSDGEPIPLDQIFHD